MRNIAGSRIAVAVSVAVLATFGLTACFGSSKPSANNVESSKQATDSGTLINNQGIPGYTYSQLRQNLIELENAQAQGVETTTFFFPMGASGSAGYAPIQVCPSIGAPIPSTDQLTNPQQVVGHSESNGGNITVGQMDPTGVYSGDSAGTYVICVGADGKPYADYWEGPVQTVFGPAKWDAATKSVQLVGAPSFSFSAHKK
jgi:hypothetical protein